MVTDNPAVENSGAVETFPVVVIGGGQAGLAISWHLKAEGIDHIVLERDTITHNWRDSRWDSFCLVTPNWQCQLPGYGYDGPDPDGFMVAAELNAWLEGYVRSFSPPVREHTSVTAVTPIGGRFDVVTTAGTIHADQVVVATGGYHRPQIPRLAERIPAGIPQLHSSQYRNSAQLPEGDVLVIGTGQSGAQIAEDLHLSGRRVHLAVGSAPRVARTYRGRDVVAWLQDMGHYDKPVTDKPLAERYSDRTNHYVTGRDGGRDIDLRLFARRGMLLHGHLTDIVVGADGGVSAEFAGDLGASLASADAVYNGINAAVDEWIASQGLIVNEPPSRYEPAWMPEDDVPEALDLAGVAAVIWATGFDRDYGWLRAGVFDGAGHPQHLRGVTAVRGLYFLGLPWLHSWGSGRFAGIARDAAHLTEHLTAVRRDQAWTPAEQPTLVAVSSR